MIRLCKDLVKNNQNKYKNHTIIFSEEILNHRMQNMKITQNIKTLHQFNLEFFLEKSGFFCIEEKTKTKKKI